MRVDPNVREALMARRPVVALESAVITHGFARPKNLEVARAMARAVEAAGAVPAVLAIVEGEVRVGLTDAEVASLAEREAEKATLWNLASLVAQGKTAGTTVAATAHLAARAGIGVFATGGIGGVHHQPFDESADLVALARTPIVIVSSGMKSVLRLEATLERLETLGVTVVGYRTGWLPAFHSPRSPYPLPARVEDAREVAGIFRAQRRLGLGGALLVFNPVSEGLAYETVQAWTEAANREAASRGMAGKALTPFLLRRLSELSGGRTDEVNVRLLLENARLAAAIAVAMAEEGYEI